jgi:hypothetical protein
MRSYGLEDTLPGAQNDAVTQLRESGVVARSVIEKLRRPDSDPWPEGEDPPWSVVERYLSDGSQGERIEAHAARSRAFRDVLRALRNERLVAAPYLRRVK